MYHISVDIDVGLVLLPVSATELGQDAIDLLGLAFEVHFGTEFPEGEVDPEVLKVKVIHEGATSETL